MAYPVTTLGVTPITCKANTNVSFTRGLRGVLVGTADGAATYDLAGLAEIGQVVCDTQTDAAAGYFLGASVQESTNIPASASENVTAGAVAYTAAAGQYSVTSTNATRAGVWRTTTAANAVGIIQRP
jgi:hypothetical protein